MTVKARSSKRRSHAALYVMLAPGLLLLLVFHYFPIYGLVMAFENFKIQKGYWGSDWVGMKHFIKILSDPLFRRAFINTIVLGLYTLLFTFPMPILLALLYNEIRHSQYKKIAQTLSYLPYFLSTVIVIGIFKELLSVSGGVVNDLIAWFGLPKVDFFTTASWFRTLYITTSLWQGVGYSSIIYLAAITGVNPELYEACVLDGAGRLGQAVHVTLPSIVPTIVILFIFAVGNVVNSDWGKILLIYSPATYTTSDVISTYVYRSGIQGTSQSYASAVGLFNSVISFAFLWVTNTIAKKMGDTSLW